MDGRRPRAGSPAAQPFRRRLRDGVRRDLPCDPRAARSDPQARRGRHGRVVASTAFRCGWASRGCCEAGQSRTVRRAAGDRGDPDRHDGAGQDRQSGRGARRMALLADAYLAASKLKQARGAIDAGLALSEQTGTRTWDAELHRLRGELFLRDDPPARTDAERCLPARGRDRTDQEMRTFEVRSTIRLARLALGRGAGEEARTMLARSARPSWTSTSPTWRRREGSSRTSVTCSCLRRPTDRARRRARAECVGCSWRASSSRSDGRDVLAHPPPRSYGFRQEGSRSELELDQREAYWFKSQGSQLIPYTMVSGPGTGR